MSQTAQKILNRFWEFLMLFIAITLGFFVENYRESLSDKEQEKEIIVSFINDIEEDIKELDIVIERREIRETRIDSILYILNNDLQDNFGRNLYYYARYLPRPFVFWANNTTNEELKYSGNFILIKRDFSLFSATLLKNTLNFVLFFSRRLSYIPF